MLTATDLLIRDAGPGDADDCGRIFFDAFAAIAHRHSFPVEPDSPEFTAFHANLMLSLEEAFDIELPDRLLRRRTFASIRSIAEALAEVGIKAEAA